MLVGVGGKWREVALGTKRKYEIALLFRTHVQEQETFRMINTFTHIDLQVALNAKRVKLIRDAESSLNVRECGTDPCRPNPCQSGGKCAVYHDNYLCLCSHPNTGDHCEESMQFLAFSCVLFLPLSVDTMDQKTIGLLGHGYLKFDQKEIMKQ